ncbi:hypothetical protein [Muribaculum intestinale]|uniref:hypothetical protein n=1 Tax=Muribaculum intestinale TaxID=1796646 RepID=UPI003F675BBD
MKKSLLFAFAMCGAVAINAMEPLSAEQLAKLTIQINDFSDNSFALSATVGPEYADESNKTLIQIQNFNGEGLPLRMNVDWENGTVSVSPYTFSSEFNEDDYMNYYLMVVSEEAANLSSPMDDAFTKSTVTGTISESGITLDSWNIVAVHPYFTSMTKKYDKPFTTKFIAPNATMSQERLDWDDDWENLVYSYSQDFRVYTEVDGTALTVYGWDDMESCVKLTRKVDNGTFTYENNPSDLIYADKKRDWYLCALPGTTWDDLEKFKSESATPLVSNPITDSKVITFNQWIIVNFGESYNNERSFGSSAKLTLDTPLQLGTSGIGETIASGAPVKVAYFNLNGIETAEPAAGIFVKVSTYADGSVKTEKVAL